MKLQTTQIDLQIPTTYLIEEKSSSPRGLLVLHGFTDRAQGVRKRLLGTEAVPEFNVLTPNGLFPSPIRKENEFREAYAWYFRDPLSGNQMISPEFAADSLIKLISQLGLTPLRWTILGFSQGGFFAPFLVRAGLNAKRIISVGAAYRPEAYQDLAPVEVHALHGEKDTIVPFETAKSSFKLIQEMGYGKQFYSLPDVAHTVDPSGRDLIREILSQDLN